MEEIRFFFPSLFIASARALVPVIHLNDLLLLGSRVYKIHEHSMGFVIGMVSSFPRSESPVIHPAPSFTKMLRNIRNLCLAPFLLLLIWINAAAAIRDRPRRPFLATLIPPDAAFNCTQRTYSQTLDHFNASNSVKFNQRIYVCDGFYPKSRTLAAEKGNIFLFLGNESPLDSITQPIVFENAARKMALIVEIEHRYYGLTQPFVLNGSSFVVPTENYRYLSIEQVLADSKAVLNSIKSEYNVPTRVPTVVIGGSYGGQLAAYHRVADPEAYQAAIAASAPVDFVYNTEVFSARYMDFHLKLAEAFDAMGGIGCRASFRGAMDYIASTATNSTARESLATDLGLCDAPTILESPSTIPSLLGFIYDMLVMAGQVNDQIGYQNFISSQCALYTATLSTTSSIGRALQATYRVYNASSPSDCLLFDPSYTTLSNPFLYPTNPAYNYQCCTQGAINSFAIPSNGTSSVLLPSYSAPLSLLESDCTTTFGPGVPALRVPNLLANFSALLNATGQIVFTAGSLDHWSAGGPLAPIEGIKMRVVIYENGSHCTDSHSWNWNNTAEPRSYRIKRAEAIDLASIWMEEFRGRIPNGALKVGRRWVGLAAVVLGMVLGLF